jgi:uncharacterized membrane protein YeaQ/YmgE (transglycosylase-associated protein family)
MGITGIIGWIVFGLIVGVVAKFLMPGRDPGGSRSSWALLGRWSAVFSAVPWDGMGQVTPQAFSCRWSVR